MKISDQECRVTWNRETKVHGLEALYDVQPWHPLQFGLCPDALDNDFLFNGDFDGVMEVRAAEAIRRVVDEERYQSCAETGTADGFSSCFIAQSVEVVRLWTCEIDPKRSSGHERPWPKLWRDLNVDHKITALLGNSADAKTWKDLPDQIDFALFDSLHETGHLFAEWNILGLRLRPGGAACFHDSKMIDVRKAIGEILEQTPGSSAEELDSCRGLTMIRVPNGGSRVHRRKG